MHSVLFGVWTKNMGEEEEEEVSVTALHHPNSGNDDQSLEFDIYPLSSYYFGSKDAFPSKYLTSADRVLRMKSKFVFFLPSLFNF